MSSSILVNSESDALVVAVVALSVDEDVVRTGTGAAALVSASRARSPTSVLIIEKMEVQYRKMEERLAVTS